MQISAKIMEGLDPETLIGKPIKVDGKNIGTIVSVYGDYWFGNIDDEIARHLILSSNRSTPNSVSFEIRIPKKIQE